MIPVGYKKVSRGAFSRQPKMPARWQAPISHENGDFKGSSRTFFEIKKCNFTRL
jgi:hypothetical protein